MSSAKQFGHAQKREKISRRMYGQYVAPTWALHFGVDQFFG
jgi:hypothetical protein